MSSRSRILPLALMSLILLVLATTEVQAAPVGLSPEDARTEATRYRGWTVSKLEISGIDKKMTSALRAGLVFNGRRGVIRTRHATLFPATLDADLRRTLVFLAQRGFPWAKVAIRFMPEISKKTVIIHLAIETGPPVTLSRLEIRGLPPLPTGAAATGGPLRQGKRFVEEDLELAVSRLRSLISGAGYPFGDVGMSLSLLDSTQVEVIFDIRPGPFCRYRDAFASGVPEDLSALAIRNIHPGENRPYSPAFMRDARRNLRELDLFRRMDLSVSEPSDGRVDLHASLMARKPRTTEVDLGYWSSDFLRAGLRWRHRNLFRSGRGGEIRGEISRFRRKGAVSAWWPTLLGPRTRATLRLQSIREYEDGYDLNSEQAEIWMLKYIGNKSNVQVGLTIADIAIDIQTADPSAYLAPGGLLTSLHFRTYRENLDDLIEPSRGYSWSTRLELAPSWLPSDNSFASAQADLVWYRRLGHAVMASRIEGGLAQPLGDSMDLLPNKRFFAGGTTSMRGARRRMLGPLDTDGSPVGGESMILASTELRFPLKGLFSGAFFLDTGHVWRHHGQTDLADLEVAIGPGLMIRTPVGPVRADVAFNLRTRPAGEPDIVLNIAIGHPF